MDYWRTNATKVPKPPCHVSPPSPSPAPSTLSTTPLPVSDTGENKSDESDDPLNTLEAFEQSLLASVDITEDFVSLEEAMEYVFASVAGDEPSYHAAMKGPDKDSWASACLDEI